MSCHVTSSFFCRCWGKKNGNFEISPTPQKENARFHEASKCTTSRRGIVIAVVFSFDQQKEDH